MSLLFATQPINISTGVIISRKLALLLLITFRLLVVCESSSIPGASGSSGSGTLDSLVGGGGGGGGGTSTGFYLGSEAWFRNLDNQLLRLGSRLDQLILRMDHLDSRIGRVHLRFDSIETSMQTTRQRQDLWSNQLNLMEEQLTRKWKNMESSLISTLDSKFNMIQRDNRRHNEFISSSFNSVIISQEKLSEKLVNGLGEVNSTLHQTSSSISNSTRSLKLSQSVFQNNTIQLLENFAKNLTRSCSPNQQRHYHHHRSNLVYEQAFPISNSNSNLQNVSLLVSSKVANMFDELVKKSLELESIVKDTFTMSNLTRREVQDGFRAVLPIVNQGGVSSAEVMSAMVVESLASVESMSTSLNRRMSELTRSVEERFEMVSMTLNGFLESCLRIQEKAPLIEEHIAIVLDRLLDTVDNRTASWANVHQLLMKSQQNTFRQQTPHKNSSSCLELLKNNTNNIGSSRLNVSEADGSEHGWGNLNGTGPGVGDHDDQQQELVVRGRTVGNEHGDEDDLEDIVHKLNVGELSEDEKKRFWESWLGPRSIKNDVPEEE